MPLAFGTYLKGFLSVFINSRRHFHDCLRRVVWWFCPCRGVSLKYFNHLVPKLWKVRPSFGKEITCLSMARRCWIQNEWLNIWSGFQPCLACMLGLSRGLLLNMWIHEWWSIINNNTYGSAWCPSVMVRQSVNCHLNFNLFLFSLAHDGIASWKVNATDTWVFMGLQNPSYNWPNQYS